MERHWCTASEIYYCQFTWNQVHYKSKSIEFKCAVLDGLTLPMPWKKCRAKSKSSGGSILCRLTHSTSHNGIHVLHVRLWCFERAGTLYKHVTQGNKWQGKTLWQRQIRSAHKKHSSSQLMLTLMKNASQMGRLCMQGLISLQSILSSWNSPLVHACPQKANWQKKIHPSWKGQRIATFAPKVPQSYMYVTWNLLER